MDDHPALTLACYHSDGTLHDAFVVDGPEQAFESLLDHYHYTMDHDAASYWTLCFGAIVVASSKRRMLAWLKT